MTSNFKARNFGVKPQAIEAIIERSFASFRIKSKLKNYAFFPLWKEIVGEQLFKVCKPIKIINKNVLVVEVLDAVWAQELTFKVQDILSQLQKLNQGAYIEQIKIVTGNPRDFFK